MKLQISPLNDDGSIVLQVKFFSEPDENEIQSSLQLTMQIGVSIM
jgi:hypothetical protein